ncbi:hypothetical protein J3D54_000232 [Pseudomonas sp. GGS8]|uniref:DUF7660 family protein n=1 Tax=Pseudomonas sp. GGS8 TaxID=2817892 RepID=UPI00209FC711|nr:hypothetical protein [Pseudomonas sp. GGS8]MCP1441100.1 hypothetical protein [Pseudomonas sp. GGS8]
MQTDLDELLKNVNDEQSFIDFISILAADFAEERQIEATRPSAPYSAGTQGWENGTIDAFLGAASAWAAATSSTPAPQASPQNVWHRCARILLAEKLYE